MAFKQFPFQTQDYYKIFIVNNLKEAKSFNPSQEKKKSQIVTMEVDNDVLFPFGSVITH